MQYCKEPSKPVVIIRNLSEQEVDESCERLAGGTGDYLAVDGQNCLFRYLDPISSYGSAKSGRNFSLISLPLSTAGPTASGTAQFTLGTSRLGDRL